MAETTPTLSILKRVQEIFLGDEKDGAHEPNAINQLLLAFVIIIVIITIVNIIRIIVLNIKSSTYGSPYIVPDTKDARKSLVVSQDPTDEDAIPLRRSINEQDGIEFSYSFWMFIEDWDYAKGKWKHVFHKGNSCSWPNRAPGVWLHPN